MDSILRKIRDECLDANRALPETGLVDFTFGNVSVLDLSRGIFAIKPSGIPYDDLRKEDIVLLDLDGKILYGESKPSSDTPTHRYLYRTMGERGVHAIVHTHSRRAVAFAQAGFAIPCLGTTHADYFAGEVPITRDLTKAEVQGNYEWETGKIIAEVFSEVDPVSIPAVIVRRHGPFAWGANGIKAVENAHVLEVVADIAWQTLLLNPRAESIPAHLLEKHYKRKHGPDAYYGQPTDPSERKAHRPPKTPRKGYPDPRFYAFDR